MSELYRKMQGEVSSTVNSVRGSLIEVRREYENLGNDIINKNPSLVELMTLIDNAKGKVVPISMQVNKRVETLIDSVIEEGKKGSITGDECCKLLDKHLSEIVTRFRESTKFLVGDKYIKTESPGELVV